VHLRATSRSVSILQLVEFAARERDEATAHLARLAPPLLLLPLALLLALAPLPHADIVPRALADVHLPRAPDLDRAGEHHLAPVGEPADDARDGKQDGEEVGWEAEGALRVGEEGRERCEGA